MIGTSEKPREFAEPFEPAMHDKTSGLNMPARHARHDEAGGLLLSALHAKRDEALGSGITALHARSDQAAALSEPIDSTMFDEARSFSMPADSYLSLGSRRMLVATLLSIMLAMACVLAGFALVPRNEAQAASVLQDQVQECDAGAERG